MPDDAAEEVRKANGDALDRLEGVYKKTASVIGAVAGVVGTYQSAVSFLQFIGLLSKPDPLGDISKKLDTVLAAIEETDKDVAVADLRANQRILEGLDADARTALQLTERSLSLMPRELDPWELRLEPIDEAAANAALAQADMLSTRAWEHVSNLDGVLWTRFRHPYFSVRATRLAGGLAIPPEDDHGPAIWDHRWAFPTLSLCASVRLAVLAAMGSSVSADAVREKRRSIAGALEGVRDRVLEQVQFPRPVDAKFAVLGGTTAEVWAVHTGTGAARGAPWSPYFSTSSYPTEFRWTAPATGDPMASHRFPDCRNDADWLNDDDAYRRTHFAFAHLCAFTLAGEDLALFDLEEAWYKMDRLADPGSARSLKSNVMTSPTMPDDWGR